MNARTRRYSILIGVLASAGLAVVAQDIREVIQPLDLAAGRRDTLVISDLFYARSYDLKFERHPQITVEHDHSRNVLIVRPSRGFSGVTTLRFTLGDNAYDIPVVAKRPARTVSHRFLLRGVPADARVTVAGSFNQWNKTALPMADRDGNGTRSATVKLQPGIYLYKFVVNGREIVDPSNPEKSPTGFDDFNSVLRVVDPDPAEYFLHVGARETVPGGLKLSFVAERTSGAPVVPDHIVALIDNRKIDPKRIRIDGSKIQVQLSDGELRGRKTLRLFSSLRGTLSNVQQAIFVDGEPAGREGEREGWEDGVIYSIMIDRYRNGDRSIDAPVEHDSIFVQANYQGGDLRGIIQTLEEGYFDSLGANIIWISPVYDNPDVAFREYPPPHRWYSGYHGYWPISDTLVEEQFGRMADLREFVTKAHARGIRVLLDFVAHHVHIDHPWYREHPDWFGTLDLPDGRKNLRLWDEYRLTTWFEPYMPSFDYTRSSEPIEAMTNNAVWWLEQTGADGFRHDAVKHVPNEFWRALTQRIKERVEGHRAVPVYQIGETFGDYDLIASYVRNGQLSAQFNFNLSYFAIPVFLEADQSFASLDFHMRRTFDAFGRYHLMGNIMDSHDKVRFMAYADGKIKHQGVDTREMAWNNPPSVDHASSYRKAELYQAYLFTIPGLPVVYYGSEFGMTGADDPDNRRMMRFGDDLTAAERSLLERTRSIVHLRRAHSALRYGDFLTLSADRNAYVYLRSDFRERLLVVLNKGEATHNVSVELPRAVKATRLRDVETGETISVAGRRAVVPVSPIGWRILVAE